MNPIPHTPLPLATTSPFTPSGEKSRAAVQGWARELELARGLLEPGEAPLLVPPRAPPSWQTGKPDSPRIAPAVVSANRFGTRELPSGDAAAVTHLAAPRTDPFLAAGAVLARANNEPETLDRSEPAPPRRPERPAPGAAVRVHLEPSAEGLSLWLGLDGHDAATRAAALLPELRRQLETISQGPVAVVCNGRTIYRTPGFPQEKT